MGRLWDTTKVVDYSADDAGGTTLVRGSAIGTHARVPQPPTWCKLDPCSAETRGNRPLRLVVPADG